MTDHETWLPAPGVGHYEVSSHGRVRTDGGGRGAARILSGTLSDRGYIQVHPSMSHTSMSLHRLICEAFHGPAPEGHRLVRHLDDNKLNNRPENLAWGTDKDNHDDAVRNGVAPPPPTPIRLFTADEVVAMRQAHADGENIGAIARRAGVSRQSLTFVIRGERYRDVGMAADLLRPLG